MGLMDKFKNLFTEEVEEEIIEEEPIKKEVIQVEIPSPARRSVEEETTSEVKVISEEPKQEEYKFPFFDDDDFNTLEAEKPVRETKRKSSYRKESAYKKETQEAYSPVKEEKKIFKPTPIISPVYGILDKNYQKEDIRTKDSKPRTYYNAKEATVDEIRNKAYGTLEDDIETTLFGHNRALFDDEPEETVKQVEKVEEIINDEDVINLIDNQSEVIGEDIMGEKPRHGAEDSDLELTDLLEEEMAKDEILEQEIIEIEEEAAPRKISDNELFDMIDSMYQKGDK
ncbi:MAG: hypothetical protein HFH47_02345 [Bacilli bacterium]|nr:hypothetical protein [Bacilli bacterium]